jgi:hypothetical protein
MFLAKWRKTMNEDNTEYKVDKSLWPKGPWHDEPDRLEWRYQGMPCLIVRASSTGALCGYVGLGKSHRYYAHRYGEIDALFDVHGGLTYSDTCQGHICHVPKDNESDEVWWLGFDCSHCGDHSPRFSPLDHDTYKDIAYVKNEVEHLADQLVQVTDEASNGK